LTDTGNGY